jgi:hypothetical protein
MSAPTCVAGRFAGAASFGVSCAIAEAATHTPSSAALNIRKLNVIIYDPKRALTVQNSITQRQFVIYGLFTSRNNHKFTFK